MSIYEYDEEGHLEVVKEEGRQLGLAEAKSRNAPMALKFLLNYVKKLIFPMKIQFISL